MSRSLHSRAVTFVTVAALAASALLVPALLPAMPASATTTATTTAAASATASASAAKSAEALDCAVTDATIRWGFKESFRSYLSGSIAHGEWTVSDGATYETPLFSWANGAGNFTGATNSGDVSFAGTVDFTGHGGILNTIIANPTLRFIDAPHASLFFDVSGTTQQGAEIDRPNVDFVSLDLSAVKPVIAGNAVTFTDVPTTLTAAGAVAFGTYEAGEAFDPITINFTAKPGCLPTPENLVLRWLPWVAAGLGLLAAAGATLVTFRRRGRPAPSE